MPEALNHGNCRLADGLHTPAYLLPDRYHPPVPAETDNRNKGRYPSVIQVENYIRDMGGVNEYGNEGKGTSLPGLAVNRLGKHVYPRFAEEGLPVPAHGHTIRLVSVLAGGANK